MCTKRFRPATAATLNLSWKKNRAWVNHKETTLTQNFSFCSKNSQIQDLYKLHWNCNCTCTINCRALMLLKCMPLDTMHEGMYPPLLLFVAFSCRARSLCDLQSLGTGRDYGRRTFSAVGIFQVFQSQIAQKFISMMKTWRYSQFDTSYHDWRSHFESWGGCFKLFCWYLVGTRKCNLFRVQRRVTDTKASTYVCLPSWQVGK